MRRLVLPLIAITTLAACAHQGGQAPLAVDGRTLYGTYQIGPSDGAWTRVTLTSDGIARYINSKGETRSGRFTFDAAAQTYCFLGDDDVPDYCSYQSYDDGVMTVGPKDAANRPVMTRVE